MSGESSKEGVVGWGKVGDKAGKLSDSSGGIDKV